MNRLRAAASAFQSVVLPRLLVSQYMLQFGGVALIAMPVLLGVWWFASYWIDGGAKP